MTPSPIVPPTGIETVAPEDVERVERWSALQRAELVRLALHLRKVAWAAASAEHDLATVGVTTAAALDDVDALLDGARTEAVAAVDAAVVEARSRIESARALARGLRRDAGLDPEFDAAPIDLGTTERTRLRQPRRARQLWESAVLTAAFEHDEDDAPVGAVGPIDPLTRADGDFWTDLPSDRRSVEWIRRRTARRSV